MGQVWVRNVDAGELFETFLVASVSAVLGIRLFLRLTGYPTLGGETLHIAHMLWGGFLMLGALVMLLGFLGRGVRTLAAALGGLGFGAFIDELGKFITADNNYFYQPAVALIYVTFVLLYLVFHALRPRNLTETERVANALEMLHEAVRHDLDVRERERAIELLEKADPADPVAASLSQGIASLAVPTVTRPGWPWRVRTLARNAYRSLLAWRWFYRVMVVFATGLAVSTIISTVNIVPQLAEVVTLAAIAVLLAAALIRAVPLGLVRRIIFLSLGLIATLGLAVILIMTRAAIPQLPFSGWAELVSAIIPALWFLLGIHQLRRSRLHAWRTFERAILFEIFVTEVFVFYHRQFDAVLALLADLLILSALRVVIRQEEELGRETRATA